MPDRNSVTAFFIVLRAVFLLTAFVFCFDCRIPVFPKEDRRGEIRKRDKFFALFGFVSFLPVEFFV